MRAGKILHRIGTHTMSKLNCIVILKEIYSKETYGHSEAYYMGRKRMQVEDESPYYGVRKLNCHNRNVKSSTVRNSR